MTDDEASPGTPAPPRPDRAVEEVGDGAPPTRSAKGTARRPAVVALLNLSGLGLGYAYLGRPVRWLVHLGVIVAIVASALILGPAPRPEAWVVALGAWVLWTALDGWLQARRILIDRGFRRRRLGTAVIATALGVVLVAGASAGAMAYHNAGLDAFDEGTRAQQAGDCDTATDRFDSVQGPYAFGLGVDLEAAERGIEECRVFQEALTARDAGEFESAAGAFDAFIDRYGAGLMGPIARERLVETYTEWADQQASAGGFEAAIETFGLISAELQDTAAAREAHAREAEVYLDWGAAVEKDDFEQAIEIYRTASERFADIDAGARAAEGAAQVYVAWGDDFNERKNYPGALSKYTKAVDDFPDTTGAAAADRAIGALYDRASQGITPDTACEAVTILDILITYNRRVKPAKAALPPALYKCGVHGYDTKLWTVAADNFGRLIDDYPNHALVSQARPRLIDTRVELFKQGSYEELGTPQRIGGAPAGSVIVEIQNDAPVDNEVLFSGPQSVSRTIERCPDCEEYAPDEEPAFCPEKGPSVEVTLIPGTYEVALAGTGVRPALGEWTLTSGSRYYVCFIVILDA